MVPDPGDPTDPTDPTTPDPTDPPVEVDAQVIALLTQADSAFQRADAALRNGDLGTYADEVAEAQRLIQEAAALLEGA